MSVHGPRTRDVTQSDGEAPCPPLCVGELTATRRSDHENIFGRDVGPQRCAHAVSSPAVAQCNGHALFGSELPDDVAVQMSHQLTRFLQSQQQRRDKQRRSGIHTHRNGEQRCVCLRLHHPQ